MSFTRRAVIDVGTNSVKLLVADVAGHDVRPVCEESKQTRLGKGFYETRRLQPEPIAKTARPTSSDPPQLRTRNFKTGRATVARMAVITRIQTTCSAKGDRGRYGRTASRAITAPNGTT